MNLYRQAKPLEVADNAEVRFVVPIEITEVEIRLALELLIDSTEKNCNSDVNCDVWDNGLIEGKVILSKLKGDE